MNTAKVIQFPTKQTDPQPLRGAEMSIDHKEDGYTALPNFIIDEGYLAVLDGEAVKCLIFLNRHIKGFHLDKKGMSETLVKKITGIKDGRTVQKYMMQLAKYQLIKIEKEKGKSNVYFLTFDNRLPTQYVGTFAPPTQHVPTSDVGTPPTQHVGGSTYMACGSVKEIYLKENSKKNNNDETHEKTFVAQNKSMLQFIEYYPQDKKRYSLKELSEVYPVASDFQKQALVSFPELSSTEILDLLRKLGQWSLTATAQTSQGWMGSWLTFLKNRKSELQGQAGKAAKAPAQKIKSDKTRHRYGQGVIPRGEA